MDTGTTSRLPAERLAVATFAERPDLLSKVFDPEIQSAVPEFMRHDPGGGLYYGEGHLEHYREFGLVAFDPASPEQPLARAFSVPFAFGDGTPGRDELPDGGWDEVIRWGHRDRTAGRRPNAVSALEIMVGLALPTFTRRCARPGRRSSRSRRSPTMLPAGGRMGCRMMPGCAPISGPAPRSSGSRRAA